MRRFTIILTALLLTLALAVPAAADPGRVVKNTSRGYYEEATFQNGLPNPWDPDNDPIVSWACDFPVRVVWQGNQHDMTYYDRNDEWVKIIAMEVGSTVTFTNLDDGKDIWSPFAGPTIIRPGPEEDTIVLTGSGVGGRLVVRGEGLVEPGTDVGRIVGLVHGDWESVEILSTSGHYDPLWGSDDPWPSVCRALA